MVLNDQQLRQELTNFGETVPPITQRNREQLRARLEVLRSQTRTRSANSPSRSHGTASPTRARAANSPSRTRAAASPSRSGLTNSPSASRAAAASPSRTRAGATANTSGSRPATRSKQSPKLIELSDSETESASTGVLMSRSVRAGKTVPDVQTRSIPLRRQHGSPTASGGPGNMTDDVEQSIARHRREIKQLLDSARDRATNTSISSLHSDKHNEPAQRPFRSKSPSTRSKSPSPRSKSPSSSSKSRTRRESSKSDNDHDDKKTKQSSKSDHGHGKKSSVLKRVGKPIKSCWKKYLNLIKNIFKALLVSSLLLGGILFLIQKGGDLFPRHEKISCSVKNATECEDMSPVIAAVRKQLQVRTGEVECGFRPKATVLVERPEIEKYLDEKGLKFNLGDQERWNALITYIFKKPLNDILVWNNVNEQTKIVPDATKLSTQEAVRSLTCRARQDVSKTLRNLVLLILGSTGLLTLAWYLQRQSKTHEHNEKTYKSFLTKATDLIQEQYEKHVKDPGSQPWLSISHIRDKLIPQGDQEKLKHVWERVKNQISKQDARIRSELQEIDGKKSDVWRWIKSATSSPKKSKSQSSKDLADESDPQISPEAGLTECLKLRNCFRSDNSADDEEIDHVIDSIQHRCAKVKRIEHFGIHSVFVYLKFSSKQAAAQGYHLLNNWNYQDREINVKYLRPDRYYEHFPEARDASSNN